MAAETSTKSLPPRASSDELRWQAVCARDPRADGAFVYSVRTTGVFCRPSCASRTALRANVRFHADCAAAVAAGFRACKRCKPDQPSLAQHHATLIAAACQRIEAAQSGLSLAQIAEASGLSRYHFHRLFKAITGVTPKAYATAARERRMRTELSRAASVTTAIYEAGYNSNGRFYAASKAALGMKPKHFRAGGLDTTIHFAVGQCSLGSILVAATAAGVCAVFLGDDPELLVRQLQDQFPKAQLIGADPDFERLVARVVAAIETPALGLDLPLDIRGTAFQRRVWQALTRIPAGSTASYGDIARALGMPKAARAVALACAANVLAVAIPCHRVIRQDGTISGYRWGIERKETLLQREVAR